jgi:hypothetical protein
MVVKFTKTIKIQKLLWEQKFLDKFEKLSKSPNVQIMTSSNQANGGIKKKLDQNYQSLNLKRANR